MLYLHDLKRSITRPAFWLYYSWIEILLRYRSTWLGPLWIVLNLVVFITFLGALYSHILSFDLNVYLPHLAIAVTMWNFFIAVCTHGCSVLRIHKGFILNGNTTLTDFVMKTVALHLVIMLHNLVVVVAIFAIFGVKPGWNVLIAAAGIGLAYLNAIWVATLFGIIGARYTDFGEMVSAVMRIAFFLTPIVWMPHHKIRESVEPFLIFNPFYHFLEIVRAPLLDGHFPQMEFGVVLVITVVGFAVSSYFYNKYKDVVVLWI